jgi:peptidoglycan/xylan/chitin deacetylase (PgdA/CDA1 family)
MEIGAHSLNHPDLTTLDPGEMARQIRRSKEDIEERIGSIVTSFCYPAGRYHAAAVAEVRAAGYTNAVTTRWDDDYSDIAALPRRRVAGATTAEELLWIVGAQ